MLVEILIGLSVVALIAFSVFWKPKTMKPLEPNLQEAQDKLQAVASATPIKRGPGRPRKVA